MAITYSAALEQFRLAEEIRIATAASLLEAEHPPPPQPSLPASEHEPEAEDLIFMCNNIVDDDSFEPVAGATSVYDDEYENEFSFKDDAPTVLPPPAATSSNSSEHNFSAPKASSRRSPSGFGRSPAEDCRSPESRSQRGSGQQRQSP